MSKIIYDVKLFCATLYPIASEKLLFGKRSSLCDIRFSHISHTSDHSFIKNISFDRGVAFARKRLQSLQTNILFSIQISEGLTRTM